jgi:hypothetical protein
MIVLECGNLLPFCEQDRLLQDSSGLHPFEEVLW